MDQDPESTLFVLESHAPPPQDLKACISKIISPVTDSPLAIETLVRLYVCVPEELPVPCEITVSDNPVVRHVT